MLYKSVYSGKDTIGYDSETRETAIILLQAEGNELVICAALRSVQELEVNLCHLKGKRPAVSVSHAQD